MDARRRRQRRTFAATLVAFALWVGFLGWMALGTSREPPAALSAGVAP